MKNIDGVKHELNPMSLVALVLSFISLALVTSLFFIPRDDRVYSLFITIDTLICLVFWLQLTADLIRSQDKRAFLKTHWPDYLASIPIIEPLRFMRVVQIFRVIRLLRSGQQVLQHVLTYRREATIATIVLLLTVLVTVGSSLILIIESKDPAANIHSADDALWWVFVTISTVGYGDHYPVTTLGKLLAAVIITCGVGLFGMVAGLISSFISEPGKHKQATPVADQQHFEQLLQSQQKLLTRIDALERKLDRAAREKQQQKTPATSSSDSGTTQTGRSDSEPD
ncbi:potassium channel family protein [Photobacterium sp. GJ3]|uniref:potassium channel family protein n=1 Tax=Photobacterium sp. GJ3 TaxID=2829502 RepID=UPI001B8B5C90|nr:potassium channel family protein [Photobacterium sp. GJ3]QUJ69015.1 potassium channel family protein [Photobacterium sp. GJ3]